MPRTRLALIDTRLYLAVVATPKGEALVANWLLNTCSTASDQPDS